MLKGLNKMIDIYKDLIYIEKHLVKAMNMFLRGECKTQGAAVLECVLAAVMDLKAHVKEKVKEQNEAE